jgi:hypothetical protein
VESKKQLKETSIKRIVQNIDTISFEIPDKGSSRFRDKLPNNAYFMNFRQYQSQQEVFFEAWQNEFKGDLKLYIAYLAEKYPFL